MIDFELPVSKGLTGYKSWSHLSRGPEGTVRQAAQREAALAKKKKKTAKVRRRFEKEKEINRRLHGGEHREEVDVERESEEPTETGDDTSSSKDEGDRGAVVTLVERCEPMATPISGGHGTKTRGDVPESRKCATSEDAALKREEK